MSKKKPSPVEYDFVLVLSMAPDATTTAADCLFDAGCDDATVSVRSGRMYLTFSRAAASFHEAVLSAIDDVRRADIGAEVLRVDQCNLVTQAEIGRRAERSRQQINQYISGERGPGAFPPPACNLCDDAPLWYWCEVAQWLFDNNLIHEAALREAEQTDIINAALELSHQQRRQPQMTREVLQRVNA